MMKPAILAFAAALLLALAACSSGGGGDTNTTCGNSQLDGDETCDDGQAEPVGGDGCSDQCQVEAGWLCAVPGEPCVADRCGDGIRAGVEECDLGDTNNGADPTQGCNADCTFAEGWVCDDTGCRTTVCGDGVLEGTEQCDDENALPFDGCSRTCKLEPSCPLHGACPATCGDGIIMLPEICDDGNTNSGDGCSADCATEEVGYSCTVESTLPATIDTDVIYRDFMGYADSAPAGSGGLLHPDFQQYACESVTEGLVENELDATTRKPVLVESLPICTSSRTHTDLQITDSTSFAQWYTDAPSYNRAVVTTLALSQIGGTDSNIYRFGTSTAEDCGGTLGSSDFFPLDGYTYPAVWGLTTPLETGSAFFQCPNNPTDFCEHDFGFTSEVRYWFTYQGDEHLLFVGDDDVWVFINGHLVVDLGGLHPASCGEVTLDASQASALELEPGGVYEVALFHAERQTNLSNFTLTLGGFVKAKSVCTAVCGDSIVADGAEECDLGDQNGVTGSGCTAECLYEGHGMGG